MEARSRVVEETGIENVDSVGDVDGMAACV